MEGQSEINVVQQRYSPGQDVQILLASDEGNSEKLTPPSMAGMYD